MHCVLIIVEWKALLCSSSDGDITDQWYLKSEQMKKSLHVITDL